MKWKRTGRQSVRKQVRRLPSEKERIWAVPDIKRVAPEIHKPFDMERWGIGKRNSPQLEGSIVYWADVNEGVGESWLLWRNQALRSHLYTSW